MAGLIFISNPNIVELSELAESIFQILQISEWSRRISSAFQDECYYLGTTLGIEIQIFIVDFPGITGYQFCARLETQYLSTSSIRYLEDLEDLISRILAVHDYSVVRTPNLANFLNEQLEYVRVNALGPIRNQVEVRMRDDQSGSRNETL